MQMVSRLDSSLKVTGLTEMTTENESLTRTTLEETLEEGRGFGLELVSQRQGFGVEDQEASSKLNATALRCEGRTNPGRARVPPGGVTGVGQ